MAVGKTDKFANLAWLSVTESAANTLTYSRLEMANNLLSEKAALIIHRADIFLGMGVFNGSGDNVSCGICLTNKLLAPTLADPETLFNLQATRFDIGVAASGIHVITPFVLDFSSLPGNGLLVPADRLYAYIVGNGCANASYAQIRIYYTVMGLSPADYWELIEARRVMTT